MKDSITDLYAMLRGAGRFRWAAVLTAWAIAMVGWGVVLLLPARYESHTKIFLETDTVLRPLLNGLAVERDAATLSTFVANAVRSRPTLERVARESGIKDRAVTPQAYETLLADLAKNISVEAGEEGAPRNVYTIKFRDSDPRMAQRVVQHTVDAFVEDSLGIKQADSSNAMQFLVEQTREYEKRLREAEDRLAEFKRANFGVMPGEGTDYYTRLSTEMGELEKLRNAYNLATQRRAELARQLDGEEPTFGLVAPQRGSAAVDARIAELKAKQEALLLQYTEKHPEIVSIRETIAQLEQQKKDKRAADAVSAPAAGSSTAQMAALHALDINPVYQSTKIALGQVDVEIVELRTQIGAAERRMADLRSKVNTIPEVEAQLARLNRDYDVNRAQYTALLQRVESARISGEVAATTGDAKFRVVEPALVPLKPVSPNRPLLATAVLILALGAGGGLAFMLNLLRPVVASRTGLRTLVGLDTLGSISLIETGPRTWRDRYTVLAGSAAALVAVYVAVLVLAMYVPAASAAAH